MVLLGLSLVASIARAESVTELLAAAATNARFEPPARADLRIECEAGCERASLRAALLGRGETVYVEVKDGVRALVRPGQVLIAEGGKAVVATIAGGIPEVVHDGVTGLLVRPRDHGAMAAAIVRLLKDDALRKRMGQAGLASVTERFSAERMVRDTLQVYERLRR